MIFYFDMLFLSQKFKFRDNQRHRWIGKLHARQSVLSDFCRGAELVKINWIEKQVAKSSNSDDYATPRKSRRKFVRTNEFFWGKKLREQNSRNLNCRGKNLLGGRWILYQKLRRKYPPQIIVFRWWDIKIYVICLPRRNDILAKRSGHFEFKTLRSPTVVRLVLVAVPQVTKLRKKIYYPQATPEALLFFYVADWEKGNRKKFLSSR